MRSLDRTPILWCQISLTSHDYGESSNWLVSTSRRSIDRLQSSRVSHELMLGLACERWVRRGFDPNALLETVAGVQPDLQINTVEPAQGQLLGGNPKG